MTKERVDWDTLWMTIALAFSQKSVDPSTKHGCVIVDENNHFVSMGYNSFPSDCIDDALPLTRPDKYKVIIHSETNAIINAGNKDLKGTTAYITGHPCINCFGNMLNAKISKIVYGPVGSYMIDKNDLDLMRQMNISAKTMRHKIDMYKYENINKEKINDIFVFLDQIKEYLNIKVEQDDVVNG